MIQIATWNVNSIRARLERVTAWLAANEPDVLCMQELKTVESEFPFAEFRALGYEVCGTFQKTYNGVGIASRRPMSDVVVGLDDGVDDPQARLVGATVDGIRIFSAYVPNGQAVGTEKYSYKLAWLGRLRSYLDRKCDAKSDLVVCGDFNVAIDERDVYDPTICENETLFHIDSRKALRNVCDFGLVDTFRRLHQEAGFYTWWDYRMLGFPKNRGLRIDHMFATPKLVERCSDSSIDRNERKGKLPSDHAPLVSVFK